MSRLQVVWFKRDLRVRDHRPLHEAARRGPVLGLYVYEPSRWRADDAHAGQLRFVNESLDALADALAERGGRLLRLVGELPAVLDELHAALPFAALWSHEETGNLLSYRRDQRVQRWCRAAGVTQVELPQNGVVRRLETRDGWAGRWAQRMRAPLIPPPARLAAVTVPEVLRDAGRMAPDALGVAGRPRPGQAVGGEAQGWQVLRSFLRTRGVDYRATMSSPLTAWEGCSRVSPHLAWGTLSMRQVHQATERRQQDVALSRRRGATVDPRWTKSLESFQGRLRWHCHFMQRLEDAPGLERRNLHRGYDRLRTDDTDPDLLAAWAEGRTGWPLVDACMRSLLHTGWLNFRMRAMLISISSWTLWQPWRQPGLHLARCFTDYEPGIHWSQVQMQSGTVGINAPRMYNPTRQARDQDPDGRFIRQWVPELRAVPDAFIHTPWEMPPLTQRMCGVGIGRDYPAPLVDHPAAVRRARTRLAQVQADPAVRAEAQRVFRQHGSRRGRPRGGWGGSARRR
ncbi:MAG: FAD-binding domain-containing protein [Myxococcota bacterium]|nr:FAD-binding domain-containing protein [Myxococcota bacterium]